jgi:FKBP-type peptidyl-prolyl cis-trans isomerase
MNMKYLLITLALCFAVSSVRAEDKNPPKNKKDKTSYGIGYNIGTTWNRNGFELADVDFEILVNGIRDAMSGRTNLVTEQETRELMTSFQTELKARVAAKRKQLGDKNKQEGQTFLAENKNKPAVHTLADGLQYKILTEGNGPKPATNDAVLVNYRGTLIDGTEFDNSAKHGSQPSTLRVNGVIKGWSEALQMMPTGSKWQLFIPSDLAYGERGTPTIAPNATLIFDLELVSIKPPEKATASGLQPQQQPVTSDIIKVPSAEELKKGAKIEIIKPDQIEKEKEKK